MNFWLLRNERANHELACWLLVEGWGDYGEGGTVRCKYLYFVYNVTLCVHGFLWRECVTRMFFSAG